MSKRKRDPELIDLSVSRSPVDLTSPIYDSQSGARSEAYSASERASIELARQLDLEEKKEQEKYLQRDHEMARRLQAEVSPRSSGDPRVGGDLRDSVLGLGGPSLNTSSNDAAGNLRAGRVRGRRNNTTRGSGHASLPSEAEIALGSQFEGVVSRGGVGLRVRGRNIARRNIGGRRGRGIFNEMFLNAILENVLAEQGHGTLSGGIGGIPGVAFGHPQIPEGIDPRLASLMTRDLNENDYETLLELSDDSNLHGASEIEISRLPTFLYDYKNGNSTDTASRRLVEFVPSKAKVVKTVSLVDSDREDEEYPSVQVLTSSVKESGSARLNEAGEANATDKNAEMEKCSVCMEEFMRDDECTRLPCLHFFHTECIHQWLKINKCCPIDKRRIDD